LGSGLAAGTAILEKYFLPAFLFSPLGLTALHG